MKTSLCLENFGKANCAESCGFGTSTVHNCMADLGACHCIYNSSLLPERASSAFRPRSLTLQGKTFEKVAQCFVSELVSQKTNNETRPIPCKYVFGYVPLIVFVHSKTSHKLSLIHAISMVMITAVFGLCLSLL